MSEKSNDVGDSITSITVVGKTLKFIEHQISRFVSVDFLIRSDTAGSEGFLDVIDELIAALREWGSSAPEAELLESLSHIKGLLQEAMFWLEEEFRELVGLGKAAIRGLVEEGRKCFKSMTEGHGMAPHLDHYGCMVDLLCRAKLVYEAFEFVLGMPIEPDEKIWLALVGACKNKGDIVL